MHNFENVIMKPITVYNIWLKKKLKETGVQDLAHIPVFLTLIHGCLSFHNARILKFDDA